MTGFNIAFIKPPKAPSLPIPPSQYSQEYFNLFDNALRLYFNQLDKVFQYTIDPNIGQYINFPFLAALDTTTQTALSAATAYPITFNSPYLPTTYAGPNDVSPYLDPNDTSKIVIPNSHYYNFSYTLTFYNPSTSVDATVAVWFRLNSATLGTIDYPGTTRYYRVQGKDHPISANCTIMLDETNGDSWQLMWATTDTHVILAPTTAGQFVGPEPTGASAALAINYVSA